MSSTTKQDILTAIQRTAKENGGKPLGSARFEKETGIKNYDWKKFWPRFGDALKEAGFEPNQMQSAYSDEFIVKKMIDIMRKLKKFPTLDEINVERNRDNELPSRNVFFQSGKQQFAQKIYTYCENRKGYEDILDICRPIIEKSDIDKNSHDLDAHQNVGEVYLFKSGRYYKIGKTNDTVRRGKELRIQLPEKCVLIHSIKTDDPNGIEAYWHKRFEAKRMNGEWFDLNSKDIKTFKRWQRIV